MNKRSLKILIVTTDFSAEGGVSSYHKSLNGKSDYNVDYSFIGKRVIEKNAFSTLLRILLDYLKFIRKIKRINYDLIHLNPSLGIGSFLRDGVFMILAKLTKAKTLVMWHGWDLNFYNKIRRSKLLMHFFNLTFLRANAFTILAMDFREQLVKLGVKKPIYLETTLFADDLTCNFDIGSRSYSNNKNTNILFLSRIEVDKGIYECADAFLLLNKRYNDISLTIAGSGKELSKVRKYIEKKHITKVHFTGYINGQDKISAFENADIFLFPTSYGEGMPITILEAMAFGLPVITRPVGGIIDFFENEKMGFITDSKDPKVFAKLLEQLINDPDKRKEISDYNYNYSKKHFKASKVARRVDQIYAKTLMEL